MSSLPKEIAQLRIPLEELLSATNNFADENLIGRGGFGKIYRGQLMVSGQVIDIVARRLDLRYGQGIKEFLSEIFMLSSLKHENLAACIGFCDEKYEKIVINKHEANGSLDRYLSDPTLTWIQRLQICVGVAHALSYIHYDAGRGFSVIHRNIKSSKILLDENWKPKLSGFGLSMRTAAAERHKDLVAGVCGTMGYVDPTYLKSGTVSHKSDMYSFGLVLFEILSGSKAWRIDHEENLHQLAKFHYEQGTLDDIIDPDLKSQMIPQSLEIFSETAYDCLNEQRSQRPDIDAVVTRLEKALELQRTHEILNGSFALLRIPLQMIVSATTNFADGNVIGQDRFGKLYKGQLLSSKKLIDIIARRFDGLITETGFWTEISMLSSLEHRNVITVVGFCFENGEKIIIYQHDAVHATLDRHLSDPTLTWLQRLQICLGAARALSYIHYNFIHCDINCSKIVFYKDWEAKIYGFEVSTKYPQSWRHRLLFSGHADTDPVYTDTKSMTPGYDVYSFGVVLFQVLCGGTSGTVGGGVNANQSLALMAKHQYEKDGKLDEIIFPHLRKQIDPISLNIFTEIAYKCLNHQLVERPTMRQIVKELDDALELQWKHENFEQPSSNHFMEIEKMERFRLNDIKLATEDFSEKRRIGYGAFGNVYEAELEHLGSVKTVAIKHIISGEDGRGKPGFFTEINMHDSCKHPNIISLLGICNEERKLILVYEYAFKGSLADYLMSTDKTSNLSWAQRIQICLNVAYGLNYLHTPMKDKQRIIHRDIKSDNILLDNNLKAKIADFGLSRFHPTNQKASTVNNASIAGTPGYIDPEYIKTRKLKKESDVYSFGVVLFEVMSGRLAHDGIYYADNEKGLPSVVRRRFNDGTLNELMDPKMMEEADEHIFTLNRGPNQDSFDVFSKIGYQCLIETQDKRPSMEVVIWELEKALNHQGETMALLRFPLSDILSATDNFSETFCIGSNAYSKVYKAEVGRFNSIMLSAYIVKGPDRSISSVAIRRFSGEKYRQGEVRFLAEIEMLASYKHPNVVSLVGFCHEGPEMMLVYEHRSNRSLQNYLESIDDDKGNLTWGERLHMCLDIARGLSHLHTKTDKKRTMIHGDIKSANILLGMKWEAKIAYFGLSKLPPPDQKVSNLETNEDIRTRVYLDPVYEKNGKLTKESDIYSLGVVLFEIFCGKLAYDPVYADQGLAPMARRYFNDGTLKKMIDHKLMEETDEEIIPNQLSLDTFLRVAYHCLEEVQSMRPTLEVVIKELEKALDIQENLKSNLHISLGDIKIATQNFSDKICVGSGRYWKAYKGELTHANVNEPTMVVAKRWDSNFRQGDVQFSTELDILFKYKHENIIRLAGYCNEMEEKVIVYEHASSKASLDKYLNDASLTWMDRLKICIDVARGLDFLHGGAATLDKMVHGDIRSTSILLEDDWKAKISNLEFASLDSPRQEMVYDSDDAYRASYDLDDENRLMTIESDTYSFGIILFEILCGRTLAWVEGSEDKNQFLGPLAKPRNEEEGKVDEMVFEGVKKQIGPKSLSTFQEIALRCISHDGIEQWAPTMSAVVEQLKEALEFQEDYEIWGPILPENYKEIIEMSAKPIEDYSNIKKKELYKMLSQGILLQKEKVWFTLNDKG